MARQSSRTTTDHDEIRRWAEARGARPARVRGTGGGGDPGMIRLDLPGFSGEERLEEISWDEWFDAFEDNRLALVYQEETSRGQQSNFNKLVGRETARARARGDTRASRRKSTATKSAARKSTAKKSAARKSTTRKRAARKSSTRKSAGRSGTAKRGSKRGKAAGKRSSSGRRR